MAVSKLDEQITFRRNSNFVFGLTATAWIKLGDYLQRKHQARKNQKTYHRLLENDDYLLRDIGLSRKVIQQMRQSAPNTITRLQLQKIRSTGGRYFSN